jgi:hypothetical protein
MSDGKTPKIISLRLSLHIYKFIYIYKDKPYIYLFIFYLTTLKVGQVVWSGGRSSGMVSE